MQTYLAGTSVSLKVPVLGANGGQLPVEAISYRIIRHDGSEAVARTALSGFTPGSSIAAITVPASVNEIAPPPANISSSQIDVFSVRECRTVELEVLSDGNTTKLDFTYALEPRELLIVGLNSFQTFPQAELTSLDIPNTSGWSLAVDSEKRAALIDARNHICQLNFWLLNSNINWGQDNINFVPEGAYPSPYTSSGGSMFIFNGNLSLLTPAQFAKLPPRFIAALRLAQVAEADFILGGDQAQNRREEGLVSDTVGSSTQRYRASKALSMPVCKRGMSYLGQFVSITKRIGRG